MATSPLHQAAHVLAAVCYGIEIPTLRIDVNANTCPTPTLRQLPESPLNRVQYDALKAIAVVFLAGPIAELRAQGADIHVADTDDDGDVRSARVVAEWLSAASSLSVDDLFYRELTVMTSELLDVWQPALQALATALGPLNDEQTRALLAPAIAHSRRLSAYHEAAHAVIFWSEGRDEVPLTIAIGTVPAESSTNWTLQRTFSEQFVHAGDLSDPSDRGLVELEIRRLVAGEEAARLIDPDYRGDIKARDDRHKAAALARHLATVDPQTTSDEIIEKARVSVRERLQDLATWRLVGSLAAALIEHTLLDATSIRDTLRLSSSSTSSQLP